MKHLALIAIAAVALLTLTACGESAPAETAAVDAAPEVSEFAIPIEQAFIMRHVDGHGGESDFPAFVLFEYEQLATVKYQVAYIACTCRGPEVNYWSVAYVEINKADGSIVNFSFDDDNTGHYTAGLYGDSVVSYDGARVQELFYEQFIPEMILGRTEAEIDAYEAMHGAVDAYTGATVTPNNAMRMLQGLYEYHNRIYG